MTLLEEAKAHMEKMREHTDCCGMPIFRRMVERVEILEDMNRRANGLIEEGANELAAAKAALK